VRHRVKRAVHVALQRRTYFDVSHEFTDVDRAACCRMINRLMPHAIVGYTGMLVDLARYAREEQSLTWKAFTLISTAEVLQCGQRELLQAQLAHEVFDSYGSREFMNIGTECPSHSGYHLQADNLWVEVVDEAGYPVPPGTEGRVVITDFHNAASPFVRYEVGDRGVMAPPAEFCGCGRPFPLLRRVEGRNQDMIYTRRGRISALSIEDVLEKYEWVEGYQMVQPSRERLIVRVLTRTELTPERVAPVKASLRERLGDTIIEFERVGELSRRANGKVDLVICSDTIAAER
jgi:phenylacetate-CoA ligase